MHKIYMEDNSRKHQYYDFTACRCLLHALLLSLPISSCTVMLSSHSNALLSASHLALYQRHMISHTGMVDCTNLIWNVSNPCRFIFAAYLPALYGTWPSYHGWSITNIVGLSVFVSKLSETWLSYHGWLTTNSVGLSAFVSTLSETWPPYHGWSATASVGLAQAHPNKDNYRYIIHIKWRWSCDVTCRAGT